MNVHLQPCGTRGLEGYFLVRIYEHGSYEDRSEYTWTCVVCCRGAVAEIQGVDKPWKPSYRRALTVALRRLGMRIGKYERFNREYRAKVVR